MILFSPISTQIPTASLSQGLNRGPLTSEVAVVVKSKTRGTQGKISTTSNENDFYMCCCVQCVVVLIVLLHLMCCSN